MNIQTCRHCEAEYEKESREKIGTCDDCQKYLWIERSWWRRHGAKVKAACFPSLIPQSIKGEIR